MDFKVLAVGDVVGEPGLERISRSLRYLRRQTGADFVIVNGENASGVGITPSQAEQIFDAGLGDLFVIRVAGNVLDRHQLGSIGRCFPRAIPSRPLLEGSHQKRRMGMLHLGRWLHGSQHGHGQPYQPHRLRCHRHGWRIPCRHPRQPCN